MTEVAYKTRNEPRKA